MEIFVFLWESFWHLLLNILVAINSVVGNPGIAIIVFTLFMRLLTVPLTMKALRSSRNMQQIQPLIKEVQKKYGKDRQKQQEELMKIYAEYGVNPAASCFPMLVQLPIFIGLYSALDFTLKSGSDVNALRGVLWNDGWVGAANFAQLFFWVPNLATEDPLHIWPVMSGVFQFIQSRMSFPRRDPSQQLDPQTKMMQNMMQFMPIYIIFISWAFPAGTVIYWTFSSIFGAVQQYFITGFGTLPDLPGLGWLPRKPIEPPTPIRPPSESGAEGARPQPKRGMMVKMMERAMEAQKAQEMQKAGGNGAHAEVEETPRGGATTRPTGPARGGIATNRIDTGEPTRKTASVLRGGNVGRDAITNGAGNGSKAKGRGSVYASDEQEDGEAVEAARYASDLDMEEPASPTRGTNGSNGSTGPAHLPRKRRNKR